MNDKDWLFFILLASSALVALAAIVRLIDRDNP